MKVTVPDTAFITSYYRSKFQNISKDSFAKLWVTKKSKDWAKQCENHISPYEPLLHSLRNRYFYDQINTLTSSKNNNYTLVNLGAGFSMYPFTNPKLSSSIELDFPELTTYKADAIRQFISSDKLHNATLKWLSGNLTSLDTQTLLKAALNAEANATKIVLIEGVFFFLSFEEINSIMQFLKSILNPDDIVYCVSYDSTIKNNAVFNRLQLFFTEILNTENNPFTTLPHSYYNSINGFKLTQMNSCLDYGKGLGVIDDNISEDDVLNEYLYTLVRH